MLAPLDPAVNGGADGPPRAEPATVECENAPASGQSPEATPPSVPDIVVTAESAGPRSRKSVVVARCGAAAHRDKIDLDSAAARNKYAAAAARVLCGSDDPPLLLVDEIERRLMSMVDPENWTTG